PTGRAYSWISTPLQFRQLRYGKFVVRVEFERALERDTCFIGATKSFQRCPREYKANGARCRPRFRLQHFPIVVQSCETFIQFSRFSLARHVFQRDRLVVVVFRPRLFRLRGWIQFFISCSLPPTVRFSSFPGSLVLARSGYVILRLRLHCGPAHAEVARKLGDSGKLLGRFGMIARVAIFASKAEMRSSIKSERGILALARCEGCLCK